MYPLIAVKLHCTVKSSTWFSIIFSSLLATVFDDIEIFSAISEISIRGLSRRHLIILRSGRCNRCGGNRECNFPAVIGVAKSITRPIPHRTKRNGGGTKAETIQIIAANKKPLVYLLIRGAAATA